VLVAGGRAREAAGAWAAAAARHPGDGELQAGLFEAGCWAQDWAAAQAAAMRLSKMMHAAKGGEEAPAAAWRAATATVLQAEGEAEAAEARGGDACASNLLARRLATAMVGKLSAGEAAPKLTPQARAVVGVVEGWAAGGEVVAAAAAPPPPPPPPAGWEAVDAALLTLLPLVEEGEEETPAAFPPLPDRLAAAEGALAAATAGDPTATRPALLAACELGRRRLVLAKGDPAKAEAATGLASTIAAYVAASGAAAPAAAADVRRAVGALAGPGGGGPSAASDLASALDVVIPCPPLPTTAAGWAAVLAAEQVKADAGWVGEEGAADPAAGAARLLTLATSALGNRAGDTPEAASPTTSAGVELACLGAGVLVRAAAISADLASAAALLGAASGVVGAAVAAAPRSPPALLAWAALSALAAHAGGTADACKALELKHVLLDSLAGHLAGPCHEAAGDARRAAGLTALTSTFHATARPEVGGAIKAACDGGNWGTAVDLAAFARRLGRSHARAVAAGRGAGWRVWGVDAFGDASALASAAKAALADLDAACPDGTPPLSTAPPASLGPLAARLTFSEDLRDRPAWFPPPLESCSGCEVAAWWAARGSAGGTAPAALPFAAQWWARSGGSRSPHPGAVAWREGRRGAVVRAWLLPRLVVGVIEGDASGLAEMVTAWEASLVNAVSAATVSPDTAAATTLWRAAAAVAGGGGGEAALLGAAASALEAGAASTGPALAAAMAAPGLALGSATGPALGVARIAWLAGVFAGAWGERAGGLAGAATEALRTLEGVARAPKAAWWGGAAAKKVAASIIAAQPGLVEFSAAAGDPGAAARAVVAALEGGIAAAGAVAEVAGRKK